MQGRKHYKALFFFTIGVTYVVTVLRFNGAHVTFILSWGGYGGGVLH